MSPTLHASIIDTLGYFGCDIHGCGDASQPGTVTFADGTNRYAKLVGSDFQEEGSYAPYAYDATYAIAHALHVEQLRIRRVAASITPPSSPTLCTPANLDAHCHASIHLSPSQWTAGHAIA